VLVADDTEALELVDEALLALATPSTEELIEPMLISIVCPAFAPI